MLSLRFHSTERHARHSVQLRENDDILAFPEYVRGNAMISEDVVNAVVAFYQEDGISRMTANSKDMIKINQKAVPVRFMEMTVLNAFQEFDKRNPDLVGRSTFYSLRPRNVKIVSPHETCMCIYHENIHLLLKVRTTFTLIIRCFKIFNRHGTKVTDASGRKILLQRLRYLP